MSFFKKLKDRMFRSSDKIGEGLEALVEAGAETPGDAPPPVSATAPAIAPAATPAQAPASAPASAPAPAGPGLLGRLFGGGAASAAEEPRRILDDAMLENLEDLLIQADLGVETATRITANIAEGRFGRKVSTRELKQALAAEVARIMTPVARPCRFTPKAAGRAGGGRERVGQDHDHRQAGQPVRAAGKKVVIAAGDTFRAAAVEQLKIWGERAGVPVLTAPEGSDPASLAFDALTQGAGRGCGSADDRHRGPACRTAPT
jgi:fused signal recognition particle receptor